MVLQSWQQSILFLSMIEVPNSQAACAEDKVFYEYYAIYHYKCHEKELKKKALQILIF